VSFVAAKQDHFADQCGSKSSMTILEGNSDIPNISEDNSYEADKKTDEIAGYFCIFLKMMFDLTEVVY